MFILVTDYARSSNLKVASSVHVCNILGNVVPLNVGSGVHVGSRGSNVVVKSVHFGSISH